MSMGYGGLCKILKQDKERVIYEYGSYNLNDAQHLNASRICDGYLIINNEALVAAEICMKVKKTPDEKKKRIIKRHLVPVPYEEIYVMDMIRIVNCSNCWQTVHDDKDYIAYRLIEKIFMKYQEEGCLPEEVSYDV